MAEDAAKFVKQWISENIHTLPIACGDAEAAAHEAIARLRADAVQAGISDGDPGLDSEVLYAELLAAMVAPSGRADSQQES